MLSVEQKKMRRGLIGGTTMTAIAGVNPWASAYDAFLELTGKVEDRKSNDAMEAGTLLEGVVLDWLEKGTGTELTRDVFIRDPGGMFCGNLDAVALDAAEPFIAEAKSTGIVGPADAGYGESESDEVPDRVIVQAHHYFRMADIQWPEIRIGLAIVPVLIGGVGFVKYLVPRNDALVDELYRMGRDFYANHIVSGVAPSDAKPSLEVLKRIRREPNKTVEIPDALVDHLIAARAAKKQAEDDAKEAETAVLTALGDAEGGTYSRGTLSYFEIQRKAYAVEATSYRSLKIKPLKEKQ